MPVEHIQMRHVFCVLRWKHKTSLRTKRLIFCRNLGDKNMRQLPNCVDRS